VIKEKKSLINQLAKKLNQKKMRQKKGDF